MTTTLYRYGDTIRLTVAFVNFAGVPTDPSAISLKVFNMTAPTVALITKVIGDLTKDSTGVYHYDYPIPAEGTYAFEYAGTVDGTVSLGRELFTAVFVS